jgi:N-acetylglutamate synthase-like GNAT family acetyltransferase
MLLCYLYVMGRHAIRRCEKSDFEMIWAIINEGAKSYIGHVPPDCLGDPYMSRDELQHEITAGVQFWGCEEEGILTAVMGLQDVFDVTLIRHAYVKPTRQKQGVGSEMLSYLRTMASGPILIGTWAAATWAIQFYERHGFKKVEAEDKEGLLRTYWNIPEQQIEISVVLADQRWWNQCSA